MKKTIAVLAAASLLAPSVSFAAAASLQVSGLKVRAPAPEIASYEVDGAGVRWSVDGAPIVELSVRCKGGERVRAEHDDGTISYAQCDGRLHAAYRAELSDGQDAWVGLEITGDRAVKVETILKLYEVKGHAKATLADKEKASVKLSPAAGN